MVGSNMLGWYGRQKISGKLRTGFGAILTLTLILSVGACVGLARISRESTRFGELSADALLASEVSDDVVQSQWHADRYMITRKPAELALARQALAKASKGLREADAEFTDGGRAQHLARLKAGIVDFQKQIDALERHFKRSGAIVTEFSGDRQTRRIADAIGNDGAQLALDASRIKTSLRSEEATLQADEQALISDMKIFVFILSIGALLMGSVIARVIGDGLSNPVRRLAETMLRLARGDETIEVPAQDRHDEIGDMARAAEVFKANAVEMQRMNQKMVGLARAEADAARERANAQRIVDTRDEQKAAMAKLAERFENTVGGIVDSVSSSALQLQSTASQLMRSAHDTKQRAEEVTEISSRAAKSVRTMAEASDELNEAIAEISRQVDRTASLSRECASEARTTDATVSELGSKSREISQVVEVISSIAAQTNLLALNATIEAARAGAAGRGFSVVAGEVKALAAKTSDATQDVGSHVGAIQKQASAGIDALREIGGRISQVENATIAIASAVDQHNVASLEVTRNISIAAEGTEAVSDSIREVTKSTTETGAAANQLLSSATDLSAQAQSLRAEVGEFLEFVRAA